MLGSWCFKPLDLVDLSSVFLVVEPSKIIFLISNTIPQKEDRILLYIGYHNQPQIKCYSFEAADRLAARDMQAMILSPGLQITPQGKTVVPKVRTIIRV